MKTSDITIDVADNAKTWTAQDLKRGFIRRVYSILSAQLFFTVGVAAIFMFDEDANALIWDNPGLFTMCYICALISLFSSLFLRVCCHVENGWIHIPLFIIFTIFFSIVIGVICGAYAAAGLVDIVLQAAIMTIGVFISLTIFTFQTKIDFTIYAGAMCMITTALILWGFLIVIFGGYQSYYWYSLAGAIIFSIWILVDTSFIIKRSEILTNYDVPTWSECTMYALDLYLDIVNLFLFLLSLLNGKD